LRVVGGRLKGRNLASPSSRDIRPTADRLRESVFNILVHAYDDPIQDARVLDLFAGTGALGIEAASRGAKYTLFVDNAAEAMQDALVREIQISTSLVASRDAIEIAVTDTGHGVTQELKERLFLPYFSTKKRGTGLGLAIVSRIIEDHHGSIRVEENQPVGTRFVVELPVAAEFIPAPLTRQHA